VRNLLLHVPKLEDFYLPFGRYMNVNYAPMGLFALANHLTRRGHPTQIVHAGIEKILDPAWRVADMVQGMDVGALGLSLHWHYQSHDVADAVRKIREARPDLFIYLGGITASFFAEQALQELPGLDAVFVGEAFEPVAMLLDQLDRHGGLEEVPNLAYRKGGVVLRNRPTFLHPAEFIEKLVFGDVSSLRNWERYAAQFGFPLAYSWDLTSEENRGMMTMGRSFFPLFVGSGCSRACSYCGGNAGTQRRINHGHRIVWRSHDKVLDDIRRAMGAGWKTMALCFDPMPESTPWYVELFRRIRESRLDVDLYFECWALPDEEFIDAFSRTFAPPHSYLALSPDSGNEAIRKRNKGYFYTNDELFRTMDLMRDRRVQADVFFSIGFPGETAQLALETRDLVRRISGKYDNVRRLMVWAVQLEPGSPMFNDPEKWGIETDRRSFADFVRLHGERGDAYSVLGYKIPGFFGDSRDRGTIRDFENHFQQLKCMEFCFHSRDPRVYNNPVLGRAECLEKRRLLGSRRSGAMPQEPVSDEFSYCRAVEEERPKQPRIEL